MKALKHLKKQKTSFQIIKLTILTQSNILNPKSTNLTHF